MLWKVGRPCSKSDLVGTCWPPWGRTEQESVEERSCKRKKQKIVVSMGVQARRQIWRLNLVFSKMGGLQEP